jgi:hypothetical protein
MVMDRSIASKILNVVISLDKELGNLDLTIRDVEDEVEKKCLGKKLVEVICLLDQSFILPILKKYPDLDPDKNEPVAL